jgi:heat shock protein HtpX
MHTLPPRPRATTDRALLARARARNRLETGLILLALAGLAAAIGHLAAGPLGLGVGLGFAAMTLALSAAPGEAVFRQALGAAPLSPFQAPGLHAMLATLSARAGLAAAPRLWLLPQPHLQAVAAGTTAAPGIGVTRSLVEALPPEELAAVLAHEVSHVRDGDLFVLRLATIAATATRAMAQAGLVVAIFAGFGAIGGHPLLPVLLILSPLVADLLTLSLTRAREFLADAGAAELTGDPAALAAALRRLERIQGDDFERMAARGPRWLRWFRTHPTVAQRVAALAAITVTEGRARQDWEAPWPVPPAPPARVTGRRNPWAR